MTHKIRLTNPSIRQADALTRVGQIILLLVLLFGVFMLTLGYLENRKGANHETHSDHRTPSAR